MPSISKRQQLEEADICLRAVSGGWEVVKHRFEVGGHTVDEEGRQAILRRARVDCAPRIPKILYLTEKEQI